LEHQTPIQLTPQAMRQIFPRAPQAVLDAFVAKQSVLDAAGITHTRTRLAYFFANIEHESGGFTIPSLTENTRYTAERMADAVIGYIQIMLGHFSSQSFDRMSRRQPRTALDAEARRRVSRKTSTCTTGQ